jgi:RimJ/RimL family protein N-acetyltransferase
MTAYPGHREADVVLRDGSTVHVRPVRAGDAPAVERLLHGLSDWSRWLRFFSCYPDLARAVRWATEVDYDHRYGLVATTGGDGRVVGHAGFERLPDHPERAEVALEVTDAMQGRGLGTILLGQLAEAAHEVGVEVLDAEVLPENHQMIEVFRDSGFPVRTHTLPGVLLVEFPTSLSAEALTDRDAAEMVGSLQTWSSGGSTPCRWSTPPTGCAGSSPRRIC